MLGTKHERLLERDYKISNFRDKRTSRNFMPRRDVDYDEAKSL